VYLGYPSKISPYFIEQIQLDGLKIPYNPSTVCKQKSLVRRVSDVTCWEIFIVSVNVGSSVRPIVSDTIGEKRIILVNDGRSVRIWYRREPDQSVKIGFV